MTDYQALKFREELIELINGWGRKPPDDQITWATTVGVMMEVVNQICALDSGDQTLK